MSTMSAHTHRFINPNLTSEAYLHSDFTLQRAIMLKLGKIIKLKLLIIKRTVLFFKNNWNTGVINLACSLHAVSNYLIMQKLSFGLCFC